MKEIELTAENFAEEVDRSPVPVLVDFWAAWCGPCRAQAPELEKLEKESDGSIKIVKVNVDENADLTMNYGIMSIPSLLVFKNGELKDRTVGLHTAEELKAMLQ